MVAVLGDQHLRQQPGARGGRARWEAPAIVPDRTFLQLANGQLELLDLAIRFSEERP